jgi:hypothetical protein
VSTVGDQHVGGAAAKSWRRVGAGCSLPVHSETDNGKCGSWPSSNKLGSSRTRGVPGSALAEMPGKQTITAKIVAMTDGCSWCFRDPRGRRCVLARNDTGNTIGQTTTTGKRGDVIRACRRAGRCSRLPFAVTPLGSRPVKVPSYRLTAWPAARAAVEFGTGMRSAAGGNRLEIPSPARFEAALWFPLPHDGARRLPILVGINREFAGERELKSELQNQRAGRWPRG